MDHRRGGIPRSSRAVEQPGAGRRWSAVIIGTGFAGIGMAAGLKRQGVEAKMVVYPRTPHGPQEPKFLADLMQRHLDWVESHMPAPK